MEAVGVIVAAIVIVGAAIWLGNRTLRSGGVGSAGVGDGMGNFIDVFDPAQARALRDRKSQESQGAIIPAPDGDDPPIKINLKTGKAVINAESLRGQGEDRRPDTSSGPHGTSD